MALVAQSIRLPTVTGLFEINYFWDKPLPVKPSFDNGSDLVVPSTLENISLAISLLPVILRFVPCDKTGFLHETKQTFYGKGFEIGLIDNEVLGHVSVNQPEGGFSCLQIVTKFLLISRHH